MMTVLLFKSALIYKNLSLYMCSRFVLTWRGVTLHLYIYCSSLLYMYKCVRFVLYDGLFFSKFFLFLVFHMQDKYVDKLMNIKDKCININCVIICRS